MAKTGDYGPLPKTAGDKRLSKRHHKESIKFNEKHAKEHMKEAKKHRKALKHSSLKQIFGR